MKKRMNDLSELILVMQKSANTALNCSFI